MSNRYGQNKGFPKTQKKFVPKAQREAHTPNPPTLSASLRQSTASSSSSSLSSSTAKVLSADNPDALSGGCFLKYLPQDEAVASGLGAQEGALDPTESQRVVDIANKELSRLLKLSPREFWKQVASDTSLHDFLDSFLQFRSRWYDFPHHGVKGTVAGVIVGDFELSRRVFMVLFRISSNRDPGAPAADALSSRDHAVLLQEKRLLDLPRLLDICAIYGHENEELTRSLVMNALKAQPWIHDNLIAVMSHFLSIVHTMHQRCASSVEALFSSGVHEDQGSSQLYSDFLGVMDFINDAIVSLDAFVHAYKPAAVFFSCPVEMSYGNEELLHTLAKLYNSLLPSLQQGFRILFSAGDVLQKSFGNTLADIAISLKLLSMRIVELGWKVLNLCYLSDGLFEGSFPVPAATKIFPAKVEDPIIRADILVQTIREINGVPDQIQEGQHRRTFLQNIEKDYKMMKKLESLHDTGWVFMDNEQFLYLSGIFTHPLDAVVKKSNEPTPATSDKMHMEEDTAIMESKISQIRDLFPDYGKGFLSACLEVYNQNPEEVIQRILEGTLHEDLQCLDTSLETIAQPKSAPSISNKDKGKGKLFESTAPSSANAVTVTATAGPQTESSLILSSSSVGRYTRKSKDDKPSSQTLDSRSEQDSARNAAIAMQYEYEDEYDDSFDDLGLSVGDSGQEETEILVDKIHSNPGRSWGRQSEVSGASDSNSKWNSRKTPQFYVKDGKNYSYKVAGSVAVANVNEASIVNQAQKELIHGLGRGGNLPVGGVKKLAELNEDENEQSHAVEMGGRGKPGNFRGRGRRGASQGAVKLTESNEVQDDQSDASEMGGRGDSRGRGRGGRGRRGGGRHFRKDQAMKKHFSGLTGF